MSEKMLKKIEAYLEGVSLKSLFLSTKKMSLEYRASGKRTLQQREEDVLAYLTTRMPATYAALCRVFAELKRHLPAFSPLSLLDVGSGSGTTLWAAADFFPGLEKLHFLEKEEPFLSVGKRLAEAEPLYPRSEWLYKDMTKELPFIPSDLVIASYALGEISELERKVVVEKLWRMTNQVLLLIEPGTPKGFEQMREIRKQLLLLDAFLLAPCPHSGQCPMSEGDWCHFYVRLNRSSLHRKAKKAELNYEDEKFSYLLFSRAPVRACRSRILRHPRKGKGHVQLTLCGTEGIRNTVVTKKEGDDYRKAKKSQWGDAF